MFFEMKILSLFYFLSKSSTILTDTVKKYYKESVISSLTIFLIFYFGTHIKYYFNPTFLTLYYMPYEGPIVFFPIFLFRLFHQKKIKNFLFRPNLKNPKQTLVHDAGADPYISIDRLFSIYNTI